MGDRALRRSLPLYANPAEKPPEGRLPLPRGYSIYASGAQTGLRGSDRRAVRGPPHPSRQLPSTVPRRLLVLVLVASDEYTGQRRERIARKYRSYRTYRTYNRLGYRDFIGEIYILNRIQQLHAFTHRAL